jgi:anaerobic selenocysteine-containing dehydrogenase
VLANNPAIAPVGESLPNAEVFRRLAARMGFEEECFRDSDDDLARQAIGSGHANLAGMDWETLKRERLAAPRAAEDVRALRQGRLPHASGKCEFYSEALKAQGMDPLPFYNPPAELPSSNRRWRASTRSISCRRRCATSSIPRSPTCALPRRRGRAQPRAAFGRRRERGIATATRCACSTTAAASRCARASTTSRGAAWWWRPRCGGSKFARDRGNANELTSQRTRDMGGAATFYDCLVEVERCGRAFRRGKRML